MMKQVELYDYEIQALIAWHRDQQYGAANDEDYHQAADHKKRSEMLAKLVAA